ncbi:Formyltetrahydrofolate deformylase [Lunatimonas lonarensis]|uniref:Formyltetrahydrofolate deformylase n=1 Tax=Lunatimonas lonarensis TaxID=1232681 RepID=R7ZSE1_9BACT|nr:formyltetrahydrofolate deformylase [Lunatimonas lonarensis]EON77025.1 Formyltetrahydrofolate deformylase [Lunatimonas lonarensis]
MQTAIMIIQCRDDKGIVAAVSDFLFRYNGNIIEVDQHIDEEIGDFFMRAEWELESFAIPKGRIFEVFQDEVGTQFSMKCSLEFNHPKPRMAIFVSKLSHCLFDILSRYYSGQFQVEIPLILSNHTDLKRVVKGFGIPFYHLPITKENKQEQEQKQLALLREHNVDFVVLARYMQILSGDFIGNFPNRIINIHHSFLPAFVGAKPYHAAHKRGVKIIGATAHYVTEELDAGPIIEQDVARVRHHNTVEEMVQMGQDVEKVVLSRAIKYHLARKIQVVGNRTIIFN